MSNNEKNSFRAVSMVEVPAEFAGQRIDNYLIRELKGVPKSKIYRILRKGEVRVNKKRVKADYKLVAADILRIPPVRLSQENKPDRVSDSLIAQLKTAVLYEDKHLFVINKPSGLAVHGGSGINLGLIEALRLIYPQERHLELVHRLDRDTSGCIMVSKKRSVLKHLHEQLRRRNGVDKRYLALVAGRWPNRRQVVNAPLLKNHLQSGERMVTVAADGKQSLTEFKVIERFAASTLVEARPVTGRTHQIRVHAQYTGHAILGDNKYACDGSDTLTKKLALRRLFLHAARLRFTLPDDDKLITIDAPLDNTLQAALLAARDES